MTTDDRSRRQLNLRTRARVPRPPIITPSPLRALDDAEDDEVEKLLREEEDEEEAAGFIVPDDYLSASEFGLS